jgi:hypothetical protein
MNPIGAPGDLDVLIPWSDILLPATTDPRTVHITHAGEVFHADYGGDPTNPTSVAASIVEGGRTWRQSKGYFYIWGHWRLFETDRTRTITWGTTAIWRAIPPSAAQSGREQIFVECGTVIVIPKDYTEPCRVINQGQYVEITGSPANGIDITSPMPTPSFGPIFEFVNRAREGHADPCNP